MELDIKDVKQVSHISIDEEKVKLVVQHGKKTITLNLYSDKPERIWYSIKREQNADNLRHLKEDRIERMKRGRLT